MKRLSELAIQHGTDKWGHHYYCDIYQQYLDKFKDQPITLLEMGFGGYEFPDQGGGSMKMWADYFTNPAAQFFVSDIYEKNMNGFDSRIGFIHTEPFVPPTIPNIVTLKKIHPDIIIDDASHNSNDIIYSFNGLFPTLKSGGIYVIEDTQTSYWEVEQYSGCADLRGEPKSSTMNYSKHLVDCVNLEYLPDKSLVPEFAKEILSIHFYEKMIFILKK